MHEKNGEVTEKSLSDFKDPKGHTKHAAYYDEDGFAVADESNKDKLKKPVPLSGDNPSKV